ncbi:MAG: threonine synthase [Thermodesulfobacteriota bacterium]
MSREIFPTYRSELEYVCQNCGARFPGDELHYTCKECNGVFLLEDTGFDRLQQKKGSQWREIFDSRRRSSVPGLQGVFCFYELIAPVLEPEDLLWLGEARTPVIRAGKDLQKLVGQPLAFKNEGQNPSGSFKDRGMACAFSRLRALIRTNHWDQVLTICASTGDTSASAAMYAAYTGPKTLSVVLLPRGKVTPQQLAQPLGSGARVFELPGVFDDCMRVVEFLAENYRVALLNSKNSWRILGQESYAFEIAQEFDWDLGGKAILVPIGNAGNISAVLSGFLKLKRLEIITELPRVIGVQTAHADPVFRYYEQEPGNRSYAPVKVKASVAQAAMIGNPVSFPRVKSLAREYEKQAGASSFQVVQAEEQLIMDSTILANRHGHIVCTQGGECLAGLIRARELGLIDPKELAVLAATAHSLKFQNFQNMYFEDGFPEEYQIKARPELVNRPKQIAGDEHSEAKQTLVSRAAEEIVASLGLTRTGR